MNLTAEFPFSKNLLNFNNAGLCPPPLSASREGQRYLSIYTQKGLPGLLEDFPGRDNAVRIKLAALLGTSPERIAITHNTSEGINTIARGFPFKKGDRILTAGKEYPANIYPWMNLKDRGVSLDLVEEETDGSLPLEKIEAAIRPETAMISISFVEWCTGYRNDLKTLASIAHNRGIPLVVDGAQGIGAIHLDVLETGIDALACPAWKWLWGPLGLGFLYMTPDFMNRIHPPFVGADSVANPANLLEFQLELAPDMRRFEYATKNYCDIIVFDKSLELTLKIGISEIEKMLAEIITGLENTIKELGYTLFGEYAPENRSGILSFTAKNRTPEKLLQQMREHGILANVRDGRIRLAPHVYMTKEQIYLFAEKMKKIDP